MAVFRWDPPLHPHGVLLKYTVNCWVLPTSVEVESCNVHELVADKQELIVSNIPQNTTIFFKVN